MDYERIHKVQVGVLSPSKLRMKLLGAHNCRKKEERSNSSSRASPSKVMDYATNSLLDDDIDEQDSKGSSILGSSVEEVSGHSQCSRNDSGTNNANSHSKANMNPSRTDHNSKSIPCQVHHSNNLSSVHPSRCPEEDGNGYENGHGTGSTSSFEFHRGERVLQHPVAGPFSRQMPSKWNDAEKWIVSRQVTHPNTSKKSISQNQGGRQMIFNGPRITAASMTADQKRSFNQAFDTKTMDYADNISRIVVEKFSFVPHCLSNMGSASKASGLSAKSSLTDDCGSTPRIHMQENHKEPSASEAVSSVQSVSMRDVGTEMTPVASQEPSRTGTPLGATTPLWSPNSSVPSTPKTRTLSPSYAKATTTDEMGCRKYSSKTDLSERELQLRTRKEIVALGMQLGKMNIASWASKEEVKQESPLKIIDEDQTLKREFEARAAAWEDAEKSRHTARFKREEIKIQAWESHQKAKFESKMREIEVRVERMKAHAQGKKMEKLAVTRQQVEEKQATSRARMNRHAARTARQVEQIRQTGRTPPAHFRCCSWFL